jgi:hypothetical protein
MCTVAEMMYKLQDCLKFPLMNCGYNTTLLPNAAGIEERSFNISCFTECLFSDFKSFNWCCNYLNSHVRGKFSVTAIVEKNDKLVCNFVQKAQEATKLIFDETNPTETDNGQDLIKTAATIAVLIVTTFVLINLYRCWKKSI